MVAKDYIINSLKKFISIVDNVKIRYKHDIVFNDHLIEITPKEYIKEEAIINFKADMYLNFLKDFKNDSLVFFTDGDFINIDKPDFESLGVNYKQDLWFNRFPQKKKRVFFNLNNTIVDANKPTKFSIAA